MAETGSETLPSKDPLEESSRTFLNTMVDLIDSLDANVPKNTEKKTDLDSAVNSLLDYTTPTTVGNNKYPKFSYANPRNLSPKDKLALKDYEHPGIHIGFELDNHRTLILNAYGGLRIPNKTSDLKDSEYRVQTGSHHTSRTDEIISHPTLLNLHINGAGGKSEIDFWVSKKPDGSMSLRNSFVHGTMIDIHPSLTPKSYGYDELKSELEGCLKALTKQISPDPLS